MHAGLAPHGDEDRIFALAELSFFYANNSGDRAYYLRCRLRLCFSDARTTWNAAKGIDPRLRWAADIYNQALTQAAKSHDDTYAIPMGGTFKLPFGELTVTFNDAGLIWADYRMKNFIPAADVEVRGLRNRYRTPGIGAPLAASIEPIGATTTKQDAYIPLRLKIPVTAFLRLDDPRGALKSGKLKGKLEFYTPDSARSIKVNGVEVPIEFETTSALALNLEGSPSGTLRSRAFGPVILPSVSKDWESICYTRIVPDASRSCSCMERHRVRRDGQNSSTNWRMTRGSGSTMSSGFSYITRETRLPTRECFCGTH